MLAAVADGLAGRVYVTGQCRFRDDAPLPYDVQEVVFADDVLPILHEIEQQVEDLGPYRDPVGAACEFPSFRVESIVLEGVVHFNPPGSPTQASGTQIGRASCRERDGHYV